MTDIKDVYGEGNLFSAKDLEEGEIRECKIKSVTPKKIGEGDTAANKLVAELENDKSFAINKTNAKRLAELFETTDYTQWVGKTFKMIRSWTTFGGEEVPCLRVQKKRKLE